MSRGELSLKNLGLIVQSFRIAIFSGFILSGQSVLPGEITAQNQEK